MRRTNIQKKREILYNLSVIAWVGGSNMDKETTGQTEVVFVYHLQSLIGGQLEVRRTLTRSSICLW